MTVEKWASIPVKFFTMPVTKFWNYDYLHKKNIYLQKTYKNSTFQNRHLDQISDDDDMYLQQHSVLEHCDFWLKV
jgi:hypothetical protein